MTDVVNIVRFGGVGATGISAQGREGRAKNPTPQSLDAPNQAWRSPQLNERSIRHGVSNLSCGGLCNPGSFSVHVSNTTTVIRTLE